MLIPGTSNMCVVLTGRRLLQGPLPRTLCATKLPVPALLERRLLLEWMPLEDNEVVGYLMTAADHEEGVNLTYPEWRALIYVASQHIFSAPHLRLESDDEAVDADTAP
jgi:hypothetical protein